MGEPSGARVGMMGLSHLRIEATGASERIVEESTLFDEMAMLTAISAARLSANGDWYGYAPRDDEGPF